MKRLRHRKLLKNQNKRAYREAQDVIKIFLIYNGPNSSKFDFNVSIHILL